MVGTMSMCRTGPSYVAPAGKAGGKRQINGTWIVAS